MRRRRRQGCPHSAWLHLGEHGEILDALKVLDNDDTVDVIVLARGGASIINVASVASSLKGVPNRLAYMSSKAAVIGFTKSLAKECGKYGVRANVVAPGLIETDLTAGLTEAVKRDLRAALGLGDTHQ